MNLGNVISKRKNKTIYRDGDRCIKLFEKGHSKADVLNEALNQARLEETELHVPTILEVSMFDGCWALVYEFIEGKTLAEIIRENLDLKEELIELMIDLQLDVHDQKCPLLPQQRDKMFRKISLTDYDETIKYELQMHLDGMPRHNKVCHGDFQASNIIMTPENVPYIIDWSHATQGNASADVARTYLLYLLDDDEENGEYYLNKFCEKTCTPRKYIEKWVRIVAASQSVKGNQKERALLDRIVNVVEFE